MKSRRMYSFRCELSNEHDFIDFHCLVIRRHYWMCPVVVRWCWYSSWRCGLRLKFTHFHADIKRLRFGFQFQSSGIVHFDMGSEASVYSSRKVSEINLILLDSFSRCEAHNAGAVSLQLSGNLFPHMQTAFYVPNGQNYTPQQYIAATDKSWEGNTILKMFNKLASRLSTVVIGHGKVLLCYL